MGIPADVLGDIIGDSAHPSPADSVHLVLAHEISRKRLLSKDGDTARSVPHTSQLHQSRSVEEGEHTPLGATARRVSGGTPQRGVEEYHARAAVVEGNGNEAHSLERGSATAGGAKARRMLLVAEKLLRCYQMHSLSQSQNVI